MNKKRIEGMIPNAYDALREKGVADKNGVIKKTYRGMISSFGAAVTMGSLLSAVCFFSSNGKESDDVERVKIADTIMSVIKQADCGVNEKNLFEYVKKNNNSKTKELVCDAAIAVKLAMNLYNIPQEGNM